RLPHEPLRACRTADGGHVAGRRRPQCRREDRIRTGQHADHEPSRFRRTAEAPLSQGLGTDVASSAAGHRQFQVESASVTARWAWVMAECVLAAAPASEFAIVMRPKGWRPFTQGLSASVAYSGSQVLPGP